MRLSFLAIPIAFFSAGCSYDFCLDKLNGHCNIGDTGGGAGTTGTTTSSSTGIPTGCELSEGKQVASECGVFVKAGGTGDGSQAKPLGDVSSAVTAAAQTQRIYICGSDTFTGSVTLPSGVSIFGGLDCATWSFAAAHAHPKLVSPPNLPTLTLSAGTAKSYLASLDLEAVMATDPGASSVVVYAEGAVVDVSSVTLTAGDGAKGSDGAAGGVQVATPAPGGSVGKVACTAPPDGGAASAVNTCDDGMSNGGKGGDGGPTINGSGLNGSPGDANLGALPGFGEVGGAWSCATSPGNGGGFPGTPGPDGPLGTGASTTELGTLPPTTYLNAAGHDGLKGTKGQGGGGGGGSKANGICNGAGGGSGGAGGCGGKPGLGGEGGGSSIGIVSRGSTLTLTSVTVSLGHGASGGKGGDGQPGQGGGGKGAGGGLFGTVKKACDGGDGGQGGNGGSAGGGRGGHAFGIAFSGTAPAGSVTTTTAGSAGPGGLGGTNGSDQGGQGADGSATALQELVAQ